MADDQDYNERTDPQDFMPDPPDVAQATAYEEDIRIERLREINDE